MFQNAWSSANIDFAKKIEGNIPANFIRTSNIDWVRITYYDEHCLECSAPACYDTCNKYLRRADGMCKRLEYGFKHCNKLDGLLWNIRVKFREWGKVEARINKGTLSPRAISTLSFFDNLKTSAVKATAMAFNHKNLRLSIIWDGLKRKKYSKIEANTLFANDFLFQCYSFNTDAYQMFFEIADDKNNTIFTYSFSIVHGFNQELLRLPFQLPEGGLVRFYPENNLEAEMNIFSADFVQLKSTIPSSPNKKIKCVAWDLDNTLWQGVLMENDPETLKLRQGVFETVSELDKRGVIQVIVSKNDIEKVIPVLKRLKIYDYFVYILANWNAKSVNIFNASKLLNIGLDTFALIDDSEFERNEVRTTLPCVRVYAENIIDNILNLPELDFPITSESINRRISYQTEAKRNDVKNMQYSGNNIKFIKNCKIKIVLKELKTVPEAERSFELIQRTNQLNLSSVKYSKQSFEAILSDDNLKKYVVFVSDKYGDYGQVAFFTLHINGKLIISEFAMSCRVAGKYIESAIFNELQKQYCKDIILKGNKSTKNNTLIEAMIKCGFTDNSKNSEILLTLPIDRKPSYYDLNAVN